MFAYVRLCVGICVGCYKKLRSPATRTSDKRGRKELRSSYLFQQCISIQKKIRSSRMKHWIALLAAEINKTFKCSATRQMNYCYVARACGVWWRVRCAFSIPFGENEFVPFFFCSSSCFFDFSIGIVVVCTVFKTMNKVRQLEAAHRLLQAVVRGDWSVMWSWLILMLVVDDIRRILNVYSRRAILLALVYIWQEMQ